MVARKIRPSSPVAAWAAAKGLEATHEVSSCGRFVRARRTGRVLKRRKDGRVFVVPSAGHGRWVRPVDLGAAAAPNAQKPGKLTIALSLALGAAVAALGAVASAAHPLLHRHLLQLQLGEDACSGGAPPFCYADDGL